MLRDELARLGLAPRAAHPRGADDTTVFTAYARGGISQQCVDGLSALGLACEMRGDMALIKPLPELVKALDALCLGKPQLVPKPILRAYTLPAHFTYEHAALLRELSRLAPGIDAGDMPLVARGLRLIEGPSSAAERTQYQIDMRRAAALALRTERAGGGLRACAYIIAIGGITYEA